MARGRGRNQSWGSGEDVALVIAGFSGWMTEGIQRHIGHHDEFGQRLFWFTDADATLDGLYATRSALIAPSEEGFGLHPVGLAHYGSADPCRHLLLFGAVVDDHPTYFTDLDGGPLATTIRNWLDIFHRGATPNSDNMPSLGRTTSTRQLLDVLTVPHDGRS